ERALADPSLSVRLAALGAWARLARDEATPRLVALAAASDRYLALRAAVQLARRGQATAALAAVRVAAGDPDPDVRAAAMNAAPAVRRVAAGVLLRRAARAAAAH